MGNRVIFESSASGTPPDVELEDAIKAEFGFRPLEDVPQLGDLYEDD